MAGLSETVFEKEFAIFLLKGSAVIQSLIVHSDGGGSIGVGGISLFL